MPPPHGNLLTPVFTPEKSIQIQENLGADIIMAFDECSDPNDRAYSRVAMDRTHRWAERSLAAHTHPNLTRTLTDLLNTSSNAGI